MSDTDPDPLDDATDDTSIGPVPPKAQNTDDADDSPDSDHQTVDTSREQAQSLEAKRGPEGDDTLVKVYEWQRHRNGDETAVLLLSLSDGWQVLALDVDGGGQVLEIEEVGDARDRQKAVGMAEYWLDQNPDGVLGGGGDGGGLLAGLLGGDT